MKEKERILVRCANLKYVKSITVYEIIQGKHVQGKQKKNRKTEKLLKCVDNERATQIYASHFPTNRLMYKKNPSQETTYFHFKAQ